MSGAVPFYTRHARQLQYTMDSFPCFLASAIVRPCQTRTSRRSIGAPRASARLILANAPMAVRRKRLPRFLPPRVNRALGQASTGCVCIAGASPSVKPVSAAYTGEAELRRSNVRTSNPSAARRGPRLSKNRKTPAKLEAPQVVENTTELAKLTLQAICNDPKAPAAARAQAARTLLELAGALKNATPDTVKKQPNEMTLGELDERLETLTRDEAHDDA